MKTTHSLFWFGLFVPGVLFFSVVEICAGEIIQTQSDSYTRYELLHPTSQSFRILYDVSASTAGARHYFNGIRAGSKPSVHGVYDRMTGEKLKWQIVTGAEAHELGYTSLREEGTYIQVDLERPVPKDGEVRLQIDKTYKDAESYFQDGDVITFDRSLGIKRNAVVLPRGYELTHCNFPSQLVSEADGRLKVSFMNRGPTGIPYKLQARKLKALEGATATKSAGRTNGVSSAASASSYAPAARADFTFPERASQDREIVYFLKQPETHSFFLYHDYTEKREGIDKYLNVVRKGSSASNPAATILDTGEQLKVEKLTGTEITDQGIDIGEPVTEETEVVVIWFDPVQKGESVRLRISETYTDANRYLLAGDELIWDRSFGRSQNHVVLPEGWYLTASAIPATVAETENSKIRLSYINDRPGNIDVFIKAKRRSP